VAPQVFSLPPVAAYRHRLVFDLYPTQVADPLETLISERLQAGGGVPAQDRPSAPVQSAKEHDPLGELIAQKGGASSAQVAGPGRASAVSHQSASVNIAAKPYYERAEAQNVVNKTEAAAVPSITGNDTDRLIIIALDPGHGGEDPGAIGPGGTQEKDVVLRLAHRLRERINARSSNGNAMRAFLTRDADYFVPRPVHQPAR